MMLVRLAAALAFFLAMLPMPATRASDAFVSQVMLPPKTPAIASFSGGSLPPHVDYVRTTYVNAAGQESLPSAELPNGVATGTLTRIQPPAPAAGAVGYNVYAVQGNGDTDTGHILQNDVPIAFDVPFDEPVTGWRTAGRALHVSGEERTIEALSPDGASVAVPRKPSIGGSIVFATHDGPESVVTITTSAAAGTTPASIAFAFDRRLVFSHLPSFLLIATKDFGYEDPELVELRDATADRLIATLDRYEFATMDFMGMPWHDAHVAPFVAEAGHHYTATLVGRPPSMLRLDTLANQDFRLPPAGGITIDAHLPPPSSGAFAPFLRTSVEPPVGVDPPAGAAVATVLSYATLVSRAPAVYDGDATLVVRSSPALGRHRRFGIAAYDEGTWSTGWHLEVARAMRSSGGDVRFDIDIRNQKLYTRHYVFALYAEPDDAAARRAVEMRGAAEPATHAPRAAIIGDSTTLVSVIQPSAPHCAVRVEAAPNCQFLFEPGQDYASRAARAAGYDVTNLSWVGTQTTSDWTLGQAGIDFQVPQLTRDTNLVIVAAGLLDCAENSFRDVSPRLDVITAAIRAFAPHARIVYVGPRYFNDTANVPVQRAAVNAWDDRERVLGARFGGFVDLRTLVPAGYTPLTPDGVHLTPAAHTIVEAALEKTLVALQR